MSGRVYQQHDWSKPYILRINQREETVEELFETPDRNIAVPGKKHFDQAHYRRACMNGEEHPLCIERHQYVMVTVCTQSIDAGIFMQADDPHEYSRSNRFSPLEMDFITSVQRRPEVEWAVDNSFDGIYVQKYEDFARNATSFQFGVYMKDEQATFWRLKFSGR